MHPTRSRENDVPVARAGCAPKPAEPVAEAPVAGRPSPISRHSQHAVGGMHGHAATMRVESR